MRLLQTKNLIFHRVKIALAIAILLTEGARRATGVNSIAKNNQLPQGYCLHILSLSCYLFCCLNNNKGEIWEDDYYA